MPKSVPYVKSVNPPKVNVGPIVLGLYMDSQNRSQAGTIRRISTSLNHEVCKVPGVEQATLKKLRPWADPQLQAVPHAEFITSTSAISRFRLLEGVWRGDFVPILLCRGVTGKRKSQDPAVR